MIDKLTRSAVAWHILNEPCCIDESYVQYLLEPDSFFFFDEENEKKDLFRIVDNIAIMDIRGPLFGHDSFFTYLFDFPITSNLIDMYKELDSRSDIEHIILNIDSPGGQVKKVSEFSELIKNSDTPSTTYFSGSGASAAYWIGISTDSVYMENTTNVGSIGTVVRMFKNDSKREFEIVSTQSPRKRLDPETDEGRQHILENIDEITETFIAHVADRRNVSIETVKSDFGRGGILTGQKALDVGMIDDIQTFETTIKNIGRKIMTEEIIDVVGLENAYPDLVKQIKTDLQNQNTMAVNEDRERIFSIITAIYGKEDAEKVADLHNSGATGKMIETMKGFAVPVAHIVEEPGTQEPMEPVKSGRQTPETIPEKIERVKNEQKVSYSEALLIVERENPEQYNAEMR